MMKRAMVHGVSSRRVRLAYAAALRALGASTAAFVVLVVAPVCTSGCAAALGIDEPNVVGDDGPGADARDATSLDTGSDTSTDATTDVVRDQLARDAGGDTAEACASGAACAPTNACHAGKLDCSTGTPVCKDTGADAANGTSCGTNEVCYNGTCSACMAGVSCTPSNPCHTGSTNCSTGLSTCIDTGNNVANGTICNGSGTCSSGSCVVPPSCAPGGLGMTNCGSGSESCCTSLEVTGGTYYRTYANAGSGPTGEADQATVSGLRLDKYLVTVGRFRQFATAWNNGAGYTPPAKSGKHTHLNGGQGLVSAGATSSDGGLVYEPGWVTSDDSNMAPTDANLACSGVYSTWTAGNDNLPINCVNWWEAYAFCIWDGGFLPSEAEWEYVAAGAQQLEYPWGTTAPGTANQYAIYGCYYPNGSGSCTGATNIAPVGTATLGAGFWGQLDLAGEVFEWTLDWGAGYVDPCTDCAYLTPTTVRVVRGGRFPDPASGLLPWGRNLSTGPEYAGDDVGFRCARTP